LTLNLGLAKRDDEVGGLSCFGHGEVDTVHKSE